jgi:outer membrane protein assembly factor BamB
MCVDEVSGRLQWQLITRHFRDRERFRKYAVRHDLGLCSSPTVDGDRVYVITNRGEVLCLDVHGLANGNDGPYHDEAQYTLGPDAPPVPLSASDPDIVWRFDMLSELKVFPHDANSCAVLVLGEVVYVATANGVDDDCTPCPDAPSLIALDKHTGGLIGVDDAKIGHRVFHGQWSSPAAAQVGNKTLIVYGGGDGVCYAFDALSEVPERPATFRCVWSCDCNPPEYRVRDGKPIDYWDGDVEYGDDNKDDGQYVGPSEIIATPVVQDNRVYVAIGRDPSHGRGRGTFTCIDATGTGDITQTGKIWTFAGLERSICTAAVVDGLVYVADLNGSLYCLDAKDGHCLWTHPTKQETWGALLVADGKVYLGTKKSLWILAAGRELKVLGELHLGSPIWSAPVAANGSLYIASQRYLWAVQEGSTGRMVASVSSDKAAPPVPQSGQR